MLIDAYWWRFWCWYWLMMIDSNWCWLICINTLFVALASLAPTPAKWVSPLWENQNIWEMFQKWILNSKTVFTGMSLVDWELVQNAKYFSIKTVATLNCYGSWGKARERNELRRSLTSFTFAPSPPPPSFAWPLQTICRRNMCNCAHKRRSKFAYMAEAHRQCADPFFSSFS